MKTHPQSEVPIPRVVIIKYQLSDVQPHCTPLFPEMLTGRLRVSNPSDMKLWNCLRRSSTTLASTEDFNLTAGLRSGSARDVARRSGTSGSLDAASTSVWARRDRGDRRCAGPSYNRKIPHNPDNRYRLTRQPDDKCGRVMVLCVDFRAGTASGTTDCQGLTDAATSLARNIDGNGFLLRNRGFCTVAGSLSSRRWHGSLPSRRDNGRRPRR
jgi:hypothetical protein